MANIRQAAEQLRIMADDLDAVSEKLEMPVQDCDVQGAFMAIRSVIGDEYVTIGVEFTSPSIRGVTEVKWRVYESKKTESYSGATLSECVNACIEMHAPKDVAHVDASKSIEIVAEALA